MKKRIQILIDILLDTLTVLWYIGKIIINVGILLLPLFVAIYKRELWILILQVVPVIWYVILGVFDPIVLIIKVFRIPYKTHYGPVLFGTRRKVCIIALQSWETDEELEEAMGFPPSDD